MVTEVRPADTDWVVAFVKGYGDAPRREAGEQLEPYPPLETLGEHDATLTSDLSEAQLVALADRLHRFFAVSSSKEAAAVVLDGLLEESAPTLRFRAQEDGYESWWAVLGGVPGTAEAPLMASCVLALVEELDNLRRFGVCEAKRCVDVFMDRSPGGKRRYCSSQCHNRSKVSAFRRRQKQSGTAKAD